MDSVSIESIFAQQPASSLSIGIILLICPISKYGRNIWNTLIYYLHQNSKPAVEMQGSSTSGPTETHRARIRSSCSLWGRGTGRVILRSDSAESGRNRDEGAVDDLAARDVGVLLDKALPHRRLEDGNERLFARRPLAHSSLPPFRSQFWLGCVAFCLRIE